MGIIDKELKLLLERLTWGETFTDKVQKVEEFVAALTEFDVSLKTIDAWMGKATDELNDIKNCSASMPLRTVWPGPWTFRKISLPRLRSSRPKLPRSSNCCPRVMLSLKMPRTSRMSLAELRSMLKISRRRWPLSATNTPKM